MPGAEIAERAKGIVERIPAALSLRLRAWKNRRRLFGLDAPATALADLVPLGSVAVDAGANRGLYTYWIARRASTVHSFEPIAALAGYLRAARLRRVRVHPVALSNRDGSATLWVPRLQGEASLSKRAGAVPVEVHLMRLDSLRLSNVGFVKIDVEGHELEVLEGAERTIREQRPVLFVEIEQRHHPDRPVHEIIDTILGLGYDDAKFLLDGDWRPLADFDVEAHQAAEEADVSSGRYVSNFLFASTDDGDLSPVA